MNFRNFVGFISLILRDSLLKKIYRLQSYDIPMTILCPKRGLVSFPCSFFCFLFEKSLSHAAGYPLCTFKAWRPSLAARADNTSCFHNPWNKVTKDPNLQHMALLSLWCETRVPYLLTVNQREHYCSQSTNRMIYSSTSFHISSNKMVSLTDESDTMSWWLSRAQSTTKWAPT